MAKAKNGVHGAPSGKIGNVVYSSWKGIPVVKKAPERSAAFTENELTNQWLFGMTQAWLKTIGPFLKRGFKNYSATSSGMTAAKSYLYKHALVKDGLNSYVDPSLMLVSFGELHLPEQASAVLQENLDLEFTWSTEISAKQNSKDQAMLLAYNVEEHQMFCTLSGDFRKRGSDSLSLARAKKGVFHVYLAFVAEDRESQSNSMYLGPVTVS